MVSSFFKVITVLVVIALWGACLGTYINPQLLWQAVFAGFVFPGLLALHLLLLLGWLVARSRFALVPLLALVPCWGFVSSVFTVNVGKQQPEGIKLLTWNVKNFDLYTWSHNTETRAKMLKLLATENADVLCLQEFYSNNRFYQNVQYLTDTLGYKYHYFPPAIQISKAPKGKVQKAAWNNGKLVQQWGVAIFSKYPMVDTGVVPFEGTLANRCIYADIHFNGRQVRVYNLHFQSIHLGYEDYATLDEMEKTNNTSWVAVKGIMRKMRRASQRRAAQAQAVKQNLDAYAGLKLVCGDFNDVPVSYTSEKVSEGLTDAFVEKGNGFGATFVHRLSFFRIDYVLLHPDMQVNSYCTIRQPLSDHYPVAVTFSW